MQSNSDLARPASYEQHPTFPTREFDHETCGDLHSDSGSFRRYEVSWPEDRGKVLASFPEFASSPMGKLVAGMGLMPPATGGAQLAPKTIG